MSYYVVCPACSTKNPVPSAARPVKGLRCSKCGVGFVPDGVAFESDSSSAACVPPPIASAAYPEATRRQFAEIYIGRNGERYGPYSLAEVQADLNSGNIQPMDLAWHEGAAGWAEVWQIHGIVLPKRRVPPPPPIPAARAPYYPSAPQKPSSGIEMALLIILTILLPIVGIIIGIVRLSTPEKRSEGGVLLAVGIGFIILWMVFLSLG